MDVISLPVRKRLDSFSKGAIGHDNVDRISKLPDEVLCNILSFLTTKEAVATSILSKRWEYVWTSTPDVDFTDQIECNYIDEIDLVSKFKFFKNFVNRVLFYHGQSIIRKCCFSLFTCYTSPDIYGWVCAVIACNVQELAVQSSFSNVNELPWRVFTCKTLLVLKIRGSFVLDLPTHIFFPCLKVLSLEYVIYGDDASMERLISSCPVLEDLAITRQEWDGVQVMRISSLSLKRLACADVYCLYGDDEYKIEINSPRLEYLELHNESRCGFPVIISSLVEAHIHGRCDFGLLEGISQVKLLVLFGDAVSSLHFVIRDYGAVPTFNNLIKMELYAAEMFDWQSLPQLLESSPNLEVLVFPKGLVVPKSGRGFHGFYWHRPESVPECLLLHLKTVEIKDFVGMLGEVYLVKYLLECAEVLERMTIQCYDHGRKWSFQRKLEEHVDYLLECPRASSTCELIFTD